MVENSFIQFRFDFIFQDSMIDQNISPIPRSTHIEQAVEQYLATADKEANDIYQVFLAELERPLLIATLKHTHGNQSKKHQATWSNPWHPLRNKSKAH